MSRMQQEIIQAMHDLETFENDGISARFSFPKEFIGFQGHFKNNPILPGICKIQAVLAMFEKSRNRAFRLTEVSVAKYFKPVAYEQWISIKCDSKLNEDSSINVKATITKEEEKVAILQLIIR